MQYLTLIIDEHGDGVNRIIKFSKLMKKFTTYVRTFK